MRRIVRDEIKEHGRGMSQRSLSIGVGLGRDLHQDIRLGLELGLELGS